MRVADVQFAFGDLFEACDHTEGRGFTTSGRADENDKFFVFDFKAEIVNGLLRRPDNA